MGNVQTVQAIYEAFGRGDVPAILDRMADGVEWEQWEQPNAGQDAGVPWLARRSGPSGVGEFFEAVAAGLEFHSFEPRNLLEGGNQVAATIRIDATAKATGERFQDEEIHLWTFDDAGKVTGLRHYADSAKHIKVTGRSPAGVA
jgi:ketosteroid isomerase-like protein